MVIGSVFDDNDRNKIGCSAGFSFLNVGGSIIVFGSWRSALDIAACTSCAAASMLRSSGNCKMIWVLPWLLVEVIESMPGTVVNTFSSGAATAEAIVSGSAPGRFACTLIVGKSTFGSSFTGSVK